jgi:hypothetical protein
MPLMSHVPESPSNPPPSISPRIPPRAARSHSPPLAPCTYLCALAPTLTPGCDDTNTKYLKISTSIHHLVECDRMEGRTGTVRPTSAEGPGTLTTAISGTSQYRRASDQDACRILRVSRPSDGCAMRPANEGINATNRQFGSLSRVISRTLGLRYPAISGAARSDRALSLVLPRASNVMGLGG